MLYEDPEAALDSLTTAFGFRERFRNREHGWIDHAEMEIGDGLLMLAKPGADYRSPRHLEAATALVHVYVDDIHAHVARAKAAGAVIRSEPKEKPYGTIQYSAADPEGHLWLFPSRSESRTQSGGSTPRTAEPLHGRRSPRRRRDQRVSLCRRAAS